VSGSPFPASLFVVSDVPEESPVDQGRAGAPDTVLDRARRNETLGRAAGDEKLSNVPQIPLGDTLGDAAGDALIFMKYFHRRFIFQNSL
jgi:hypothetical protein